MTVDLAPRRALWTDATLGGEGGGHHVWRYRRRLAALGRDLADAYRPGTRVTLRDLACWHAAARTREGAPVHVRVPQPFAPPERRDAGGGATHTYRRRSDESVARFAERLREGWSPDAVERGAEPQLAPGTRAFCALVEADLTGPTGAYRAADDGVDGVADGVTGTAYRLFPGPYDAAAPDRVTAGDLVAELAPRTV
ncbi:hypothetical protein [Streptomyces phytohabitans]|uniref:hypothetical protein n=1 Tax=Streptomyces phytohabitans TaxID=1150371 RepID=UPI00345BBCEB